MTKTLGARLDFKKMFLKFLGFLSIIGLFILLFNLFPTVAFADGESTQTPATVDNSGAPGNVCQTLGGCLGGLETYSEGDSVGGIFKFIRDGVNIAVFIAVPIGIIFVVWGGYQMITSQGDEKKYAGGLNTLQYAVIGLVVVILATTIVGLISGFLANGSINSQTSQQPAATQPTEELPEDISVGVE
jgi:hypothetical protein